MWRQEVFGWTALQCLSSLLMGKIRTHKTPFASHFTKIYLTFFYTWENSSSHIFTFHNSLRWQRGPHRHKLSAEQVFRHVWKLQLFDTAKSARHCRAKDSNRRWFRFPVRRTFPRNVSGKILDADRNCTCWGQDIVLWILLCDLLSSGKFDSF